MCHDAASLGVAVDPLAMFRETDPDALAFVSWVVEMRANTERQRQAQHEAEMAKVRRRGS